MMNEEDKTYFKSLFNNILMAQDLEALGEQPWDKNQKGDEIDIASSEREQLLARKLQGRKSFFIKKIEASLQKIENGSFGECEECGADISLSRLKARPTATMCIHCKEEQESGERHIPYEKKSHTLGQEIVRESNVIHIQFGEDGNNGKPMPSRQSNRTSIPNTLSQ